MKTTTMIMVVVGGLMMQAVAAGPDKGSSASTNIRKTQVQTAFQLLTQPKTAVNYKIDRVGNVSSRPWAQTVGWPDQQGFVGDQERLHEAHFNLFWIGATPP
jgi:hypothetical protein